MRAAAAPLPTIRSTAKLSLLPRLSAELAPARTGSFEWSPFPSAYIRTDRQAHFLPQLVRFPLALLPLLPRPAWAVLAEGQPQTLAHGMSRLRSHLHCHSRFRRQPHLELLPWIRRQLHPVLHRPRPWSLTRRRESAASVARSLATASRAAFR